MATFFVKELFIRFTVCVLSIYVCVCPFPFGFEVRM